MSKIIKYHKLDPNNYTKLLDFQRRGYINYTLREFGYEKVEEIVSNNPRSLEILINLLKDRSKDLDAAYSVYHRNRNIIKSNTLSKLFTENYVKSRKIKYIPSSIYEQDDFMPQEAIKDPSLSSKYLSLKDLDISREKVIWVDSKNIKEYQDIFAGEKVLGLDSEFCSDDNTSFSPSEAAILQVSSSAICVIFDCTDLRHSAEFKNWLVKTFDDESILKIGHSFHGDIRALNQTFGLTLSCPNLADVVKMTGQKRSVGLKTMVNVLMGKEFSKFNQMSGWFKRPLREAQIHYAALDAVVMLPVYQKLVQLKQAGQLDGVFAAQGQAYGKKKNNNNKHKHKNKNKYTNKKNWKSKGVRVGGTPKEATPENKQQIPSHGQGMTIGGSSDVPKFRNRPMKEQIKEQRQRNNRNHKKKKYYLVGGTPEPISPVDFTKWPKSFLIDPSMKRLATTLRNLGIDAANNESYTYRQLCDVATRENRVIISRNRKFKLNTVNKSFKPINNKLEDQIFQLRDTFGLEIKLENFMTRCVKCNHNELKKTDFEGAKDLLEEGEYVISYDMRTVLQFWVCPGCKQVYWNGGSYKKAVKNYRIYINSGPTYEGEETEEVKEDEDEKEKEQENQNQKEIEKEKEQEKEIEDEKEQENQKEIEKEKEIQNLEEPKEEKIEKSEECETEGNPETGESETLKETETEKANT